MVVFPNAKVNLGLNILRKRPDGYHDIATVMVPVSLCDILEIVPARAASSTLTVTGRAIDCPPDKNLVIKALAAVRRLCTVPDVDIYLEKVIPDGAGMGGGSADAAFTIRALNELFALGLSSDMMRAVAAEVGSDCPFFIDNRPALATGRGEILTPVELDLTDWQALIVKPEGCSVSTAAAYAGVVPHKPEHDIIAITNRSVDTWQGRLINDFEAPVSSIHPVITQIRDTLIDKGAVYASMTGSGAAVFGMFHSGTLPDLTDNWPDMYVATADFVGR